MENAKQVEDGLQAISAEQATSISGGDAQSCPVTVNLGPITETGPSLGAVLTDIYNGFVEVTSTIIERVANAAK